MTDTMKADEEIRIPVDLDNPANYINRELSLLDFQKRVLEEALDETNPLLERVKFLSIVGSNLDEFFMVRFAGLKRQVAAGINEPSFDGLTPAEQLAAIRKKVQSLMDASWKCLRDDLMPQLDRAGIHILKYDELSDKHRETISSYFEEIVFPVLTPLAFDPGHPFPHISNLSLNLAVILEDETGLERFARVKVPSSIPRLVPIKRSSGSVKKDGTVPHHHYFVWLDEVIAANIDRLFPGLKILDVYAFRVIRNADMNIQELEAGDLLETIERTVSDRRFGFVVRVSIDPIMPARMRSILVENLKLDPLDVFTYQGPLGLASLMYLYEHIDRYDLKYPAFVPALPNILDEEVKEVDFFHHIRQQDILVQHPYDSFAPVMEFLETAATDPKVLAIKQTLYRVGKNAPVVDSLLHARRMGKQVAVLVELKARFDEESNISWARKLEREGVHVIYGLLGLKTHSKIALVIRKEGDHIRRYVHLGTGNYNEVTAHLYEDLGLFTCDPEIGADTTELFNYLTGYAQTSSFHKLLVAPINLRQRLEELILREIEVHQKEGNGHLIFKVNSLADKPIMKLLYQASIAGVRVDLIVRGICSLRPGVKQLSENIRVVSVLGRFLEHSRVYYFHNNGSEEIYLGSADLLPRNLNTRVEVLFPIENQALVRKVRDDILNIYLADNVKARVMAADGTFHRIPSSDGVKPLNSQQYFLYQRR